MGSWLQNPCGDVAGNDLWQATSVELGSTSVGVGGHTKTCSHVHAEPNKLAQSLCSSPSPVLSVVPVAGSCGPPLLTPLPARPSEGLSVSRRRGVVVGFFMSSELAAFCATSRFANKVAEQLAAHILRKSRHNTHAVHANTCKSNTLNSYMHSSHSDIPSNSATRGTSCALSCGSAAAKHVYSLQAP